MTTANERTHSEDIAQEIAKLQKAYRNVYRQNQKLMDCDDSGAKFRAITSAAHNLACLAVYLSDGDEELFEGVLAIANEALNEIGQSTFADAVARYQEPPK